MGGPKRLFSGGVNDAGSNYNDVLDNEMSKPQMSRMRSTNLLSDAGSKYGGDDDDMSHYMGQSALGGVSNVGGADVGSNVGGYNRQTHASAGGAENTLGRSSASRRQQVLERNNMTAAASGRDDDSRRGVNAPAKPQS